jgi:hypothetical protein
MTLVTKEMPGTGPDSYGFSDTSQVHMQHLIDTPFPWDSFKKLSKDGVLHAQNKETLPDGGEYIEIVFPKSHEDMALHYMLTVWKESFTGFPATVKAVGEGESIVIQTQFIGPNPVKK